MAAEHFHMGRAHHLVSVDVMDRDVTFTWHPFRQRLEELRGPVRVLGYCLKARTGKSVNASVASAVAEGQAAGPFPEYFQVGDGNGAVTRGIWARLCPFMVPAGPGGELVQDGWLLVLDSEGTGNGENEYLDHVIMNAILAVMGSACSTLVLMARGGIDDDVYDGLARVVLAAAEDQQPRDDAAVVQGGRAVPLPEGQPQDVHVVVGQGMVRDPVLTPTQTLLAGLDRRPADEAALIRANMSLHGHFQQSGGFGLQLVGEGAVANHPALDNIVAVSRSILATSRPATLGDVPMTVALAVDRMEALVRVFEAGVRQAVAANRRGFVVVAPNAGAMVTNFCNRMRAQALAQVVDPFPLPLPADPAHQRFVTGLGDLLDTFHAAVLDLYDGLTRQVSAMQAAAAVRDDLVTFIQDSRADKIRLNNEVGLQPADTQKKSGRVTFKQMKWHGVEVRARDREHLVTKELFHRQQLFMFTETTFKNGTVRTYNKAGQEVHISPSQHESVRYQAAYVGGLQDEFVSGGHESFYAAPKHFKANHVSLFNWIDGPGYVSVTWDSN